MAELTEAQLAVVTAVLEGMGQRLAPLTERLAQMEQDTTALQAALTPALASSHKPGLCQDTACQMCRDSRTVIARQAQDLTRSQLTQELYAAAEAWDLGEEYDRLFSALERARAGERPDAAIRLSIVG